VHRASVVQYLSVRGNYPASVAGSPRTISVSKRGPVVFPWARVISSGGNPPLAETMPGRMAAARARRIS